MGRVPSPRCLAALVVLALSLAVPGEALAVPANAPLASWPQVNGQVNAIAVSGNRVFIGGSFTQVGGQTRYNLAAIDATTGAVDPSWNASTGFSSTDHGGPVDALAVSGPRLYVGGQFKQVDGFDRPRLAAVKTADGLLDGFDPHVNAGAVRAIAVTPTRVYAGGVGIAVGVQPARPMWAFDPVTGDVDSNFITNSDHSVRALLATASRLYAAGEFSFVDGAQRRGVVALDLANGAPTTTFDAQSDGDVNALSIVGSRLFLAGSFAHVGGQPRVSLAAVNSATGAVAPGWRADADGSKWALARSESRLYAAGVTGSFGSLGERNLAAARLDNGHLSPFFAPVFSANAFVRALAVTDKLLVAGGNFTDVQGQPHQGLAAFRLLVPASASAPYVQGNPVTGSTLACNVGSWRNDPTSFGYRWLRNGTPIASTATYKVVSADVGRRLACRVAAINPAGAGAPATSAAVIAARRDVTGPKVGILGKRLKLHKGAVVVRIGCPKSETRCSGTVALRAITLKDKPLAGVAAFHARGGRTAKAKVRLSSAARQTLARRHRLRVRVTANARDAAGNARRVSRKLTIRS